MGKLCNTTCMILQFRLKRGEKSEAAVRRKMLAIGLLALLACVPLLVEAAKQFSGRGERVSNCFRVICEESSLRWQGHAALLFIIGGRVSVPFPPSGEFMLVNGGDGERN